MNGGVYRPPSHAQFRTRFRPWTKSLAVTQKVYPDADVSATGWDTAPTASQDLYVQVDESTPSDTDYIFPTA